jgi:hypothetical protein
MPLRPCCTLAAPGRSVCVADDATTLFDESYVSTGLQITLLLVLQISCRQQQTQVASKIWQVRFEASDVCMHPVRIFEPQDQWCYVGNNLGKAVPRPGWKLHSHQTLVTLGRSSPVCHPLSDNPFPGGGWLVSRPPLI